MTQAWVVQLLVAEEVHTCAFLSQQGQTTVGRSLTVGLRVDVPWVSALQMTIQPVGQGLLLTNGPRTRMKVRSPRVSATVRPLGRAFVDSGERTRVTWPELDGALVVKLEARDADGLHLPLVRDPVMGETRSIRRLGGTDFGELQMGTFVIDSSLRHRMAVLFAHVFDDAEPPSNLYRHAAGILGSQESPEQLKTAAQRLRLRINCQRRGTALRDAESLGYYLVETAKLITERDLKRPE